MKEINIKKHKKIDWFLWTGLVLVVFLVGVYDRNKEFLSNDQIGQINSNFKEINNNEGLVLAGEDVKIDDSAAMKSDNFWLKQVRFGGDTAFIKENNENETPSIIEVRSENFSSGDDGEKSNVLVSWKTNKLTVSEIEYSKRSGQDLKKMVENDYSFNHGVVLSELDPSTSYVYQIKVRDRWENETTSGFYGIFTGARVLSVFDMISDGLNDIFGWAIKK